MFKKICQILCDHEYEEGYVMIRGKRERDDSLLVKIQPFTCTKCDKHINVESIIEVKKNFYKKHNK